MLTSIGRPEDSAGEVARILAVLRTGAAADKVTRKIASQYPGNPGIARYLVDVALACLWLADGAPTGDVLTVLECRHRFEFSSGACRAYALEILWATERQIQVLKNQPKPIPKETEHAAA